MITHKLSIGNIIWDTHDGQWGRVVLINGKSHNVILMDDLSDSIVTYVPLEYDTENNNWLDGVGENETWAENVYPLISGVYFHNEFVCLEINKDMFDSEHDYDLYCPTWDSNCWKFEADTLKKPAPKLTPKSDYLQNMMINGFKSMIENYGDGESLHTFDVCSNGGIELCGSTIDKIVYTGNDILFYYNENTGDYDNLTNINQDDAINFYNELIENVDRLC